MDAPGVTGHEGQVCDRCRLKKTKCDGVTDASPSCSNCVIAGVQCEVSAKLRRKTKFRGYTASSTAQDSIEQLKRENAQLRSRLQTELEASKLLRKELEAATSRPLKARKVGDRASHVVQASAMSPSGNSDTSLKQRSALILKHMGRMVHDQADVGRFAGSTTGVHFISSVEEIWRRTRPHLKPFPEDCFRLHIVEPRFAANNEALVTMDSGAEFPSIWTRISPDSTRALLDQPVQYYVSQLDLFHEEWITFCPVIPRLKFARDVEEALGFLRSPRMVDSRACSTILTMIMVLLVNRNTSSNDLDDPNDGVDTQPFLALACELYHPVVARGDLSSLQALILFSFYLQTTNVTSWLVHLNGAMVRIAQSLGMHRHARRFRFTVSETELRKRMWWWVYSLDKLTSAIHGMPQLIHDLDVDNDLPIDCDLEDITASGMSYPLPGEPSPVVLFIHYIHLSKTIASILSQLYTTTQRRDAENKISRLDRDMNAWHGAFNSVLQFSSNLWSIDDTLNKQRLQRCSDSEGRMIAWLDLMAHYAMILIHRPALTFESSTSAFKESLQKCVSSASTIIQLASASSLHDQAIRTAPLGSSLIFQCALMHIFHSCHPHIAAFSTEIQQSPSILSDALQLLRSGEASDSTTLQRKGSGATVIPVLETLLRECGGPGQEVSRLPTDNYPALHSPPGTGRGPTAGVVMPVATPQSPQIDPLGADIWSTSALESLNHLDILDISHYEGVDPFGMFEP